MGETTREVPRRDIRTRLVDALLGGIVGQILTVIRTTVPIEAIGNVRVPEIGVRDLTWSSAAFLVIVAFAYAYSVYSRRRADADSGPSYRGPGTPTAGRGLINHGSNRLDMDSESVPVNRLWAVLPGALAGGLLGLLFGFPWPVVGGVVGGLVSGYLLE